MIQNVNNSKKSYMRNVQEGCMGQLNRILLSVATFREEIIKDNKICSNRMSWQK